jgi:hypothetical protein
MHILRHFMLLLTTRPFLPSVRRLIYHFDTLTDTARLTYSSDLLYCIHDPLVPRRPCLSCLSAAGVFLPTLSCGYRAHLPACSLFHFPVYPSQFSLFLTVTQLLVVCRKTGVESAILL